MNGDGMRIIQLFKKSSVSKKQEKIKAGACTCHNVRREIGRAHRSALGTRSKYKRPFTLNFEAWSELVSVDDAGNGNRTGHNYRARPIRSAGMQENILKESDANRADGWIGRASRANDGVVEAATWLLRQKYVGIAETFIIQFRYSLHAAHIAIQINAAKCIQNEPAGDINLLHSNVQPSKGVSNVGKSCFDAWNSDLVE